MSKYDDIINMQYPRRDWNFEMKHPRMSMQDRAKIFAPFAALRGFEDAIVKKQQEVKAKK